MRRFLSALLAPFALVAIVPAVVTLDPTEPALAGGGCHQEQMTDAAGVTVDMAENCFAPTVLRVVVGESVRWTNQDQVAHSVTGVREQLGKVRFAADRGHRRVPVRHLRRIPVLLRDTPEHGRRGRRRRRDPRGSSG